MTEKLTEIPKPKAEGFKKGRKIYLVPTFFVMAGIPDEFREKVDRYWMDVRDQVENLERSLSKVTHVYHESVFETGDEGLKEVEQVNAHGHSFVNVLCRSTAKLEATDHREALTEAVDWRRCLSAGLTSEKVAKTVREAFDVASKTRYAHMATVIDETLVEDEAGLFIVNEDHQVQFPSDIQVFYISPPSLDGIKRWLGDQMREMIAEQEKAASEEDAEIDADLDAILKEDEEGEDKKADGVSERLREYPY